MSWPADLSDPHWFELIPDSLAILDDQFAVRSTRADVPGLAEIFHPEDLDQVMGCIERCRDDGPNGAVPTRALVGGRWVDGWATFRNYLANPLVNGLLVGWHPERHGEAQRREIETQIAAARDAAIEASRLKSEFLANMSHEIRTPLNGVIGMATLLLDTALNRDQLDRVVTLRSAGEHLLALVNDILDFSKIETGRLELERHEFELMATVQDVVSLYTSAAFDKGVRLRIDTDASLPRTVIGDSARLRQILSNLVGNAVKFTEQGSITLRITSEGRHSSTIRFEVVDTGIGIDKTAQARIFDPFVQAESSTTRRFGGTGLGLPICRQLVELMGGILTVESAPDDGSTFWFTIPFGDTPGEEHAPHLVVPEAPPLRLARAGRILLVEDNVINQQVALGFLQHLGWEADVAGDGLEALELTARQDYGVILMDCQMPRMDGYEATGLIRAADHTSGRHTPIIALTAGAMPGDRERCLEAGMDDYLSKPIDIGRLSQAIDRWFNMQIPALEPLASAPPAGVRPAAEIIDEESVDQLRRLPGSSGSLFDDAFAVFVSEAPLAIAAIADLCAGERWSLVAQRAHTLKGMSATVGARRVSELAAAIEQAVQLARPDTQALSELIPELDHTLTLTAARLSA